MPENTTSHTTVENLKAALKVKGTKDDDMIAMLIDSSSVWVESLTNRKFKARDYDNATTFATTSIDPEDYFYFDGTHSAHGGDAINDDRGYGQFYCPQFPIQRPSVTGALPVELSILTARIAGADGAGDTWSTTTYLEGRDYLVDYPRGIIQLTGGPFPPGLKNFRLKCTAGYLIGDNHPFVPKDLERLCIELCRMVYKDRINLQSESLGTWHKVFNHNRENPIIRDTIDIYTRISAHLL